MVERSESFPPNTSCWSAAGRSLTVPALQSILIGMPTELPERTHLKRIPVWIPSGQSVIYFVTACCAERREVFSDNFAVDIALESLLKCAAATNWNILQICFMPDHVHLLAAPTSDREQKLSRLMQRWKSSSKQRLNRSGIEGDIWQKEFFDRLLRSNENLTDKWRYAEMNPVRAGLCERPDEYPYLGSPQEILNRL